MKKITILSVALIAISMASCSKKDRVCSCTEIDSTPGAVASEFKIVYKNSTSKNASAACMSLQKVDLGSTDVLTRTCTLN